MTRYVGIVGHEAAKFTPETEREARAIIAYIIAEADGQNIHEPAVVVSGHCHLGGIDIWAEEMGRARGQEPLIFPPKTLNWAGFEARNVRIAEASDELHCIVVAEYPPSYTGMRFNYCYHCKTDKHKKSGGCWTAKYFERIKGTPAQWHVIVGAGAATPRGSTR